MKIRNIMLGMLLGAMVSFSVWGIWQIATDRDIDDALPAINGGDVADVSDAIGRAVSAEDIPCEARASWYAEPGAQLGDEYCTQGLDIWCWNGSRSAVVLQEFVGGENVGNWVADVYDGGPTLAACMDKIRAAERGV